jgi:hypothetical protein
MNIPTLIILIIVVLAVAGAIISIFIKHRKHKGSCEECDAQGCALRPLLSKKKH